MRRFFASCFTTGIFLPSVVYGAVTINEVAWMGDTVSANHEWIELYNSGSAAVSLAGAVLTDGMNLTIELMGDIAPGEYAVLERSNDDSAPGTAFLVYSGALVNTGATLTLRAEGGEILDQVAGGEGWQNIGGDNATKETAQYTSAGWVTDTPTPGAANRTGRPVSATTPTKSTEKSVSSGGGQVVQGESGKTVLLRDGGTELVLAISSQTTAYVGQPVAFAVSASGVGTTIKNSLRYQWNFGDSYTASGTAVRHTYRYPGTYVVTVEGAYAKHKKVVRQEVMVLPMSVSVGRSEAGDVLLNNDSPYDIDLSGYHVVGTKTVTLPPYTILLPRATLTLAAERVGASWYQLVEVHDRNRSVIASTDKVGHGSELVSTSVSENYETPLSPRAESLLQHTASVAAAAGASAPSPAGEVVALAPGESDSIEPDPAPPLLPEKADAGNRFYGLLFLLLCIACAIILLAPKSQSSVVSLK